jgi:hypothetical protein
MAKKPPFPIPPKGGKPKGKGKPPPFPPKKK